jgi:hypothetical protein
MTPIEQTGLFGFKYWPFAIVPGSNDEIVWADRATLKQQIVRLGQRLSRHTAVSLHLLWADFGAGKTHTLLYLKQQSERGQFGPIIPFYCALPKGCRDFIDIYRAIVRNIPVQVLRDAYKEATQLVGRASLDSTLSAISPNLPRCIQAIAIGSESHQRVAMAWLHAEVGLPTRELHSLSIIGRLRSTDDAMAALCGIVRLFNIGGHKRVLLMVDEFQRVEVLRKQQQDDINAGLHGFFNSCPSGMSLLLSFSFGVEENIRHFLNRELLSRVDPLRLSIPAMSEQDGITFLNDVIAQARGESCPWPVSEDVVPSIVAGVASSFKLTPRRLLKAASLVFELAEIDLESGAISKLTSEYVSHMIAQGNFTRIDEQEEDA